MNYLDIVDKRKMDYFKELEPDFPLWLVDYINTSEMLKQQYISITCGTIYSDLFESSYFFSSLDHGIAVALIIWHFTHDKKQTLAGLFHDIATPVFKHCIDFLNGDYVNQESTEDLTTEIIANSKGIMRLLERDNILLSDVNDYHIYPIADNDTPKLSADRLEYSLSNGLFTYNVFNFDEMKRMYNDVVVGSNEDGTVELMFKTEEIAVNFVSYVCKLSVIYMEDRTRYSMQFLADIIKKISLEGKITVRDLYNLKESDVIRIIEESSYGDVFRLWKGSKKVKVSKTKPNGVYFVLCPAKVRYIDPLVSGKRVSDVDYKMKNNINNLLEYDFSKYVYLDFNLE